MCYKIHIKQTIVELGTVSGCAKDEDLCRVVKLVL